MIRRFPRLNVVTNSMNRVYEAMENIVKGKATLEDKVVAWQWSYVESKEEAKQFLRKGFDGHIRHPRVKYAPR